ncbi:hypothetical protein PspLS_07347, partial [Pyricularia sp. CBS 133598]
KLKVNVSQVHFVAHGGEVQGVGFRFFTQKRANEQGVTGWVKNIPNNKVEGEAQGNEQTLDAFLKDVDKGPKGAHVVKLDKEDRDLVQGEIGFEVHR